MSASKKAAWFFMLLALKASGHCCPLVMPICSVLRHFEAGSNPTLAMVSGRWAMTMCAMRCRVMVALTSRLRDFGMPAGFVQQEARAVVERPGQQGTLTAALQGKREPMPPIGGSPLAT